MGGNTHAFLRRSFRIFTSYLTAWLLSMIFILFYLNLAKEKFIQYLPFYSLIFFAILAYLIYRDVNNTYTAVKLENKNRLSSLFYVQNTAFTGFLPFTIAGTVCFIVSITSEKSREAAILIYNSISGPLLFLSGAKATESGIPPARFLAFVLSVPLLAAVCYYIALIRDTKE